MIHNRFFCVLLFAYFLTASAGSLSSPNHNHHDHDSSGSIQSKKPTYHIDLKAEKSVRLNQPAQFTLKILDQAGQLVPHHTFEIMHGRRIHALIIDPSLQDYQHLHLEPTHPGKMADYHFTLTPKQAGDYTIYLDVVDKDQQHAILSTQFEVAGTSHAPLFDKNLPKGTIQSSQRLNGFTVTATLSALARAREPLVLNIMVKEHNKPFDQLEPLMEAYAHLVGFSANDAQVIHAHPMGEEPVSDKQRGGPTLSFGLEFPKPGDYRLFLQVQVAGKQLFFPLDVNVLPPSSGEPS